MHHTRLTIKYKWGGENNLTPFFTFTDNYKIIKTRGDVRMSKINVGDLRKYSKSILKEDVVINVGDMKVSVKQHTSVTDKFDFAISVYKNCVTEEDETHLINSLLFSVAYKTGLVKRYTNLTLPKDDIEAYNLITNTGLYDQVYENISDIEVVELERIIEEYVADKQEKYEQEHSMGYIAKRLIGTIADILPDTEDLNAIMSSIQGLSNDNVQSITNDVVSTLEQKVGE